MRKAFISIISAMAALLSSCSVFDNEIPVTDLGFDVKTDIVWNSEYMAYTLRLSLNRGAEGEYVMNYSIDSDPLISLSTSMNGTVQQGSSVQLSSRGGVVFVLPALTPSKAHTLEMDLSRDGVHRHYEVRLPDTNQKQIGARMDTSDALDFTRVILTNLMGPSVTSYRVTFYLDGEPCDGMKYMSGTFGGSMELDFARSESYTFELPFLVAGEHVLKIDVQSTLGSENTSIAFIEPQRRQTSLIFRYNDFSGNLCLSSDYNPSNTGFEITADITVKGTIHYRPDKFFGVADTETETFTRTGESKVTVTPGLSSVTVDNGTLKRLMDEVFAITRTDAANGIGNGNRRTLNTDISSIDIRFTIHSTGAHQGNTAVSISPAKGSDMDVRYTYTGRTWYYSEGYVKVLHPTVTVNGKVPGTVTSL